jgi:SAM-dependent methyltransferase
MLPKPIWSALSSGKRWAINLAADAANFVSGLPPRSLVTAIGGGDIALVGNQFLAYFKDYAYLSPDEHVLDVGCGVGRMAIPLTKYLSKSGSYDGFDIMRRGIDWCHNRITIDCVVYNLSDRGARIQISNTTNLPEKFKIAFDGGHSLRPHRIVWRTFNETSVEFSA